MKFPKRRCRAVSPLYPKGIRKYPAVQSATFRNRLEQVVFFQDVDDEPKNVSGAEVAVGQRVQGPGMSFRKVSHRCEP